jgi:cell division protein FtsZ
MFEVTDTDNLRINGARIKVVGVGGGGCNAVNTMIRSGLSGVEYIVANTDAQALNISLAPIKIQLGGNITKGLGAGANPEVGKKAALEDYEKISEVLKGADMVFITAGMGGGTGTGAAPIIAKLAKDLGALTVGVVTKPFVFEGKKRFKQAEEGIRNLEESVDSLITIPNQRLLFLAGENLSLVDTFKRADEVLLNAVRGISDLINNTGHINADFADVSTVMANKGLALMGTGSATGAGRAIKAATEAISSPLLEDVSINGATGIIINITGSESLSMHETNEAVTLIMEAADDNAEIIFGTVIDNNCGEEVKVTVIATGLGHHVPARIHNAIESHNTVNAVKQEVAYTQAQTQVQQIQSIAVDQEQSANNRIIHQNNMNTNTLSRQTEERDIFSRKPLSMATSEEEKSDFDRFMNDRNSFSHNEAAEESSVVASNENKQPSRLIQSIRDAANKYENPAAGNKVQPGNITTSTFGNRVQETSEGGLNSRAKSIAEKLGFVNFDEDEFDTPSYLKREEKPEPKSTGTREFKSLDL